MSFGYKLKTYRNLNHLSQKELAKSAKLKSGGYVQISQYENGTKVKPRTKKALDRLAEALAVSPQIIEEHDIDDAENLIFHIFWIIQKYGFKLEKDGDSISIKYQIPKNPNPQSLLLLSQLEDLVKIQQSCDKMSNPDKDLLAIMGQYPRLYCQIVEELKNDDRAAYLEATAMTKTNAQAARDVYDAAIHNFYKKFEQEK